MEYLRLEGSTAGGSSCFRTVFVFRSVTVCKVRLLKRFTALNGCKKHEELNSATVGDVIYIIWCIISSTSGRSQQGMKYVARFKIRAAGKRHFKVAPQRLLGTYLDYVSYIPHFWQILKNQKIIRFYFDKNVQMVYNMPYVILRLSPLK